MEVMKIFCDRCLEEIDTSYYTPVHMTIPQAGEVDLCVNCWRNFKTWYMKPTEDRRDKESVFKEDK